MVIFAWDVSHLRWQKKYTIVLMAANVISKLSKQVFCKQFYVFVLFIVRKVTDRRWRHDSQVIFLTKFSSNTNPKWPVNLAFSNSPAVVRTENIWCVFRMKPPFLNSFGVLWTVSNSETIQHQLCCKQADGRVSSTAKKRIFLHEEHEDLQVIAQAEPNVYKSKL